MTRSSPSRPHWLWWLALGAGLVLGQVGPAPAAHAHELDPDVRSVLDEVVPDVDGLTVEVHRSIAPQVVAEHTGDEPVTVLDTDGRPFLRFSPDGVEADLGLASFYRLNDPTGQPPPEGAVRDDPDAGPVWSRVAAAPVWGWFDHRMHPAIAEVPDGLADRDRPVTLSRWQIPLQVGSGAAPGDGAIRGRIVHQPVRGSFVVDLDALDVEGVQLTALQGRVPGLFLTNRSGRTVAVRGIDGEPFLVFAPDGRVQANVASPTWWAHARTSSSTPVPDVAADADADPVLREVSTGGAFGWLLPAAAFPDEEPDDVGTARVVRTWEVAVVIGGDRTTVTGRTAWVPDGETPQAALAGSGGSAGGLGPADLLAAGAGIVAVAALVVVRRARRRRDTPVEPASPQ
jgi:hypothetical protein